MNRRHLLAAMAAAAALPIPARAGTCNGVGANAADIAWLIDQMAARYAYLPDRHIDMAKLRHIYAAEARAACDPHTFLGVLERFLAEFHDHHIEARGNNSRSPQLVPTGTDLWAITQNGRAFIKQVRLNSASEEAGVRAGDEVVAIGGIPAMDAVAAHGPRCLSEPDPEAADYTLRVLLAGTHDARRVFSVRGKSGAVRHIDLPSFERSPDGPPLTTRRIGEIAYFRVENSLGDPALVGAFDRGLDALGDARALIVDLRETPSGGNTDVAEPIMGRFVAGRPGYQRVFDPRPGKAPPKDTWVKVVPSRGKTVALPLAVLVCRWTGRLGEGMAIGLDGLKRATVIGTGMAGLCGATDGFTLPESGLGVNFPTERLYHLDGTPREKWKPPVLVDLATARGADPILARAVEVLGG